MARPLAMASSAGLAAAALTVRAAGHLSPRLGAAAALPLFMNTRPRMRLRPSDVPTMLAAERSTVPVPGMHGRGGEAVAYAWEPAESPVLLVHGWGGRAAQYAPLVRALHDAGIGTVAFDAPAHGDSPGRGTYIVDFQAAITELARRHGPFRAAVGHSFGAFATLIAVAEGLEASRVAAISAPPDSAFMISSFAHGVGLGPASAKALRDRFARRILPHEPQAFERYNAVDRPFPGDVPCLFVHDTADPVVPLAEAERLVEARQPNASLVTTTGLGHYRTVSDPAVVEAVTAFIADGARGPSARP
ncbi:alpha/beta fold hydrolase [Sinomonas sp. ASV322]|uniref:alpha/beta hydrolase n=1 Tax=Sinomonas sp. ASV322 TaxID=3041920 RepID=UPI0027DDFD09|nr:alpha/beta fold hydrolase [Sinomonas sp. ASV322]MDQ4503520.1 alpha/beta fold hydrolase [Sinomonas sp. ASV322]